MTPKMPKPSKRNPFPVGSDLAKQYHSMLASYAARHPDIIHEDGRRCLGNTMSSAFWKGYDLLPPYLVAQGTWAWACYRAGQTQRLKDDDNKKKTRSAAIAVNEFGDMLLRSVNDSKEIVEEFMKNQYGKVWTQMKENGARIAQCEIKLLD